jgi:hypothetical protein
MATLSSKVCRKNQGPTLRLCICTLRILPLHHSQSVEPCLSPMGMPDPSLVSAKEFVDGGRGGVGRGGGASDLSSPLCGRECGRTLSKHVAKGQFFSNHHGLVRA